MQAVGYSLLVVCLALYAGCVLSQTDLPTPASEPQPEEKPAATVTEIPEPTPKPQSDCTAIFDLDKKYKSPRGDVEASGTDLTVQGEKYECVTYFVDNLIFNSAMGYKCWSILRQSPGSYLVTDRTVEAPSVEDPKNITESEVCVAADAAIPPNKRWTMIKTGKFLPQTCHPTLAAHMFSFAMNEAGHSVDDQWLCVGSKLDACYRHQYVMVDNVDCHYLKNVRDGKTKCVANYVTKDNNNPVNYQVLVDDAFKFYCLAFSGGNYNNETGTSHAGILDATLVEGACHEDQTAREVDRGYHVRLEELTGYKCGGANAVAATSVVVLLISALLASLLSV